MPQPKLISDWETPASRKAARTATRKIEIAAREDRRRRARGEVFEFGSVIDNPDLERIAEMQRRLPPTPKDIQPGDSFAISGDNRAVITGNWRERAKAFGLS